jgi:hypothetical protein
MLIVFTYAHCFDICSLFLYMLTEFIYGHCFYICSLCLYVVTIFIYAHCLYICSLFYICSLSLHMLTVLIYAHCFDICSLSSDMLTVFICGHYFYICSLSLYMLTVLIYAHWVYICSLFRYMITIFTYAHCFYICVAWSISSWLLSGSVDHLWSDSFFAPTSTLSSLPYLASDEIVQLQKLFGIWADDLKLVRNLASLPTAPTVFVDMPTVFIYDHCFYDAFMLQVLDQMMIDMSWDLLSMSICSLFL